MKAKLLIKYFSVLSFVLNSMAENYPCANIYLCLSKLPITVLSHSWYHDSSSWTEGCPLWKAVRTLSKKMFISTQGAVGGGSKEKVLIIVQPVSEQEKSVMNFGNNNLWNFLLEPQMEQRILEPHHSSSDQLRGTRYLKSPVDCHDTSLPSPLCPLSSSPQGTPRRIECIV